MTQPEEAFVIRSIADVKDVPSDNLAAIAEYLAGINWLFRVGSAQEMVAAQQGRIYFNLPDPRLENSLQKSDQLESLRSAIWRELIKRIKSEQKTAVPNN